MTDFVWCPNCGQYTPGMYLCPFCRKAKDGSGRLTDDYGSRSPRDNCMVRMEDGRSIHFYDDREGRPYFCRETVYDDDPEDGNVVESFYVIHDTDSLGRLLEDEPESYDAENGIVEGTVDVYGDDRTIRYTRDPIYIPELNMKPKKVREKGYCPFCGNNVKASHIGGRPCCPDCGSSLMPPVSRRGRR